MRTVYNVLIAVATMVLAASCAAGVTRGVIDDEDDGSGGSGGASTSTASASSSTGGPVDCSTAEDCKALNSTCKAGQCVNGTCVLANANQYGACDDGLYCTEDDTCQDGVCAGLPKFCASQDSCHIGVCDEDLKTCKNLPGNEGQPCDDGNSCTYMGMCNSGVCGQGQMINCSVFDSSCTKGVCDPVVGCKAIPWNDGVACDDQLYCTINDKCSNGMCLGAPNTCAAPGDACMIGSCNEATDKCVAVPGNNGAACDDKNLCTTGETCSNGLCLGGQPANEGMLCDDKNGCTGGTSCLSGACANPQSQIVSCVNSDMCCPAGCMNDNDCLYWKSGVQQNLPVASLTGWTQCWSGGYGFGSLVSQVLQQCDKGKLLIGCRQVGAPNLKIAAMGPRDDVLFDCGQQASCTKQSNGVGFYFSDTYSWGFAQGGEPVSRNSCDTAGSLTNLRMCWHTWQGNIDTGYRCGDDFPFDNSWERVVYEAD